MANGNNTTTGWNWLCQGCIGFIAIVLGGIALVLTQGGKSVSGSFSVLVGYIIGLFAAIVLARMLSGQIDLQFLISEDNGHASTSRFQFIIFTFVIASSYFLAVAWMLTTDDTITKGLADAIAKGTFKLPDIPTNVLGLMGISGGSYVISKRIRKAADSGGAPAGGGTVAQAIPVVSPPPAQ